MKKLLTVIILFWTTILFAQDTTELIKFNDGTKSFKLITKNDTNYIYLYPNEKRESIRPIKNDKVTGKYSRWYENGKLMWEKELLNGIQNGKTVLYDQKGTKVAELNYDKGILKDTVYLKEQIHLIIGKITYSSKVYGGMQREDGSSNISEHSGPYMNYSMYTAKIDSLKKSELIQNFKSDFNGDFFVLVPEGKIAFFPKNIDIKTLLPGHYDFPQKVNYTGNESWSMNGPTIITKDDLILFITLHHSSVGYAP
jgi:hypothetical protein